MTYQPLFLAQEMPIWTFTSNSEDQFGYAREKFVIKLVLGKIDNSTISYSWMTLCAYCSSIVADLF